MNCFTACGIYHAEVEAMLRVVDQVQEVTLAVRRPGYLPSLAQSLQRSSIVLGRKWGAENTLP
jgi:hypothetical protein